MDQLDKCLNAYFEKNAFQKNKSVCIFRAMPVSYLKHFSVADTMCVQTYKPFADLLNRQGFRIVGDSPQHQDVCVVLVTKSKEESLFNIAVAVSNLKEDGVLIVAAANALGAVGIQKQMQNLLGTIDVFSKSKCRLFSCVVNQNRINENVKKEWLDNGRMRFQKNIGFYTCPGIFGWQKIDAGSRLLMTSITEKLWGRVADLGCGYGYLSVCALRKENDISALHLFETEEKALAAARMNLSNFEGVEIHYNWCDVVREVKQMHDFDCVLMNPPFHSEKAADYALGESFIISAAALLKTGGVLYMVANKHLPYEKTLSENKFDFEFLIKDDLFKIIRAIKK
jgi:16S rRNA (guanine1207-N2)-methyltransferase